jgi:putative oxidoreductase
LEVVFVRALSAPFLQRLSPAAPIVLRLTVGGIMAVHGWQKLTEMGPAMFGTSMLADLGLPAPALLGWVVTLTELTAGTLLVLGLLTRLSAALLSGVLLGAAVLVKPGLGIIAPLGAALPGAELDLALLAGAVGVLLLGPGRPSLDHRLGIETAVPQVRDDAEADGRVGPVPVRG